jgi:hypothetical protein
MRNTLGLKMFVSDHGINAITQSGFRPYFCCYRAINLGIELGVDYAAVHEKSPVVVIGSSFHFIRQESVAFSTPIIVRRADLGFWYA